MRFLRKKAVLTIGLATAVVLGAALAVGLTIAHGPGSLTSSARAAEEEAPGEAAIAVKTIRPKRDPSFTSSIEQPAFAEAYYQADLMARVAGPIKPGGIVHEIGDRVKADEVLVEIDVPDLEQDLQQKEAVIAQRLAALDLARKNEKIAKSGVDIASAMIDVKEAQIKRAEASWRFREKELTRFQGLVKGPNPAVTLDVVDERIEDRDAAAAGVDAARAGVKEAKAELEKARAQSEAAAADIKVADSLVGVARTDRDKATALLGFATLRAPFDGVVTRRNVDPGTFVQNAATAHTEPLLTVVRDDLVTVYMKVPDKFAPFVNRDTEAIIQMDTLPGVVIRGKVTRYAPSLDNPEHDRTMRVEVDLYNGSAEDYKAFVAKEKATGNSDLKSKTLPVFPKVEGKDVENQPLHLIPGQYGTMRLVLSSFRKAFLLPRGAVVSQGGTSYVFVVKNGVVLKMPVEVQADNGEEVKVALIEKVRGQEVKRELTGDEEIVFTNQGELSNGQAVKTTRVEW
ncbi:MAG TPA: efflux RND transporter periplasmic adaptor subunit [Gemmataceae bacterium]|nr:efflux RND transporter periplasmic adaptor subunit [Gemmataceae bacterium]